MAIHEDTTKHMEMEEVLRESEEYFRLMADTAPVLIWASGTDALCTFFNKPWLQFTGRTLAQELGNGWAEGVHPDDRQRILDIYLTAFGARREFKIEYRLRRADGEYRWLFDTGVPRFTPNGAFAGYIGSCIDITDRIRAEESMRESEERYRSLYNETPVMLHSIDHNWSLISVSNYWLETLGYERSEVIGRKTTEFLTDASRRYAEEAVLPQFFRTGHCKDVPYQLVKKNGEIIDVLLSAIAERDASGEIKRTLAVMIDVTERKRAEEALRESEEKFSKAFQATPTMLVLTSLEEGRFIEVNEAFEQLCGYERKEVIGRTSLELNIWKDPGDRRRVIRMLQKKGSVHDLEINFKDKFGKTFVGLYSAELIEIGGEPCLLSLVNDITARKRLEEEIEVLNTDLAARAIELETANRELEAFNYTVSHDLRKPLTNINGYCQVIQEICGAVLNEQCRGYVREIYGGTLRMNRLIDTLLDFSRISRCEIYRETLDLSDLAKSIAAEFRLTEPQRRVNFAIAEKVVAYGDARLLRVVLENLIGNSWKYTGKQEEAFIEFGTLEIDGKHSYFVRDNGPGFDMTHADRLFTAFQRLPGTEEFVGHGIGLATVQRVIERHGGRVWAEGEVGKGATFYFTL